jgi:hypothetical protein
MRNSLSVAKKKMLIDVYRHTSLFHSLTASYVSSSCSRSTHIIPFGLVLAPRCRWWIDDLVCTVCYYFLLYILLSPVPY